MTTQQELADAVRWLKDDARFRVFIRRLSAMKEAAVEQCLAAATSETAEPLRMEARALTNIIRTLKNAGVTDHETSSGTSAG